MEAPNEAPPGDRIADQARTISRMVVSTVREYSGRGPTKIHTDIASEVITVVMRDSLTKAESSLVRSDQGETVIAVRRAFQQAMRHDLVGGIERITGRTVEGFFSDHQLDPDIAVETFVLVPVPAPSTNGAGTSPGDAPA